MTRSERQKSLSRQRQLSRETKGALECPTPNKSRFMTQGRAITHALKSSKNSHAVKVYKCKCQGWHLTTQK